LPLGRKHFSQDLEAQLTPPVRPWRLAFYVWRQVQICSQLMVYRFHDLDIAVPDLHPPRRRWGLQVCLPAV